MSSISIRKIRFETDLFFDETEAKDLPKNYHVNPNNHVNPVKLTLRA
jgi:hypothetical protein